MCFYREKTSWKNNTAISHVAFFNHLDLQHQLKRFNSQNPLGLKRVPFVTFVKNILLFFCRTVRCIFFCFLSSWSQCNCWCFYLMYYQKYWEERQNRIIRVLNGGGALVKFIFIHLWFHSLIKNTLVGGLNL